MLQVWAFVFFMASTWAMGPRVQPPILWNLDTRDSFPGSPKLEAISSRQNIWRPWSQWKNQPPQFDSLLKEGAVVMATGSRVFQTEVEPIPELYLDTGGAEPTFLPGHPIFTTLNQLVQKGIIPVIDLGPPPIALCDPPANPTSGAFDFHILSILDSSKFEKYHSFLIAFFKRLKNDSVYAPSFSRWRFQLHREPDNPQAFDPLGLGKHADDGNLQVYLKLYDWTLSAMRAAGLSQTLDFGNMAIPLNGMAGCKQAWNISIAHWLASQPRSWCPHLVLPRLKSGDTVGFSFTAYANSQIGTDPRDFQNMGKSIRDSIASAMGTLPFRLTVGEGNIYHWPVTHRGDASPQGAAWNAAIFKICQDLNISRFQQWGFFSADNISIWQNQQSLPSASYHVVGFDQSMAGSQRMNSHLVFSKPLPADHYLDAYAGHKGLKYQAMIFHFSKSREDSSSERIILTWDHLPPNARIRSRHSRVDSRHGSYLETLKSWLDLKKLPGDPYDGLFSFQLDSAQKSIVNSHFLQLRKASANTDCQCESSIPAQSDMEGRYQRRFDLPANSVSWFELEILP